MGARRRDGARRTEVETARTAGDARPRMGAEVGGEVDVARLVELPNEVRGLPDRGGDGGAVPRIGPEIAVAQFVRREERRTAGKTEHQVAMRHGTAERRPEARSIARGRSRRGEVVDGVFVCGEMAGAAEDSAGAAAEGQDDRPH